MAIDTLLLLVWIDTDYKGSSDEKTELARYLVEHCDLSLEFARKNSSFQNLKKDFLDKKGIAVDEIFNKYLT